MNDILPIFPLRIVVFPNENIKLYIFEPRYKAMITDCIANNSTFGIIYYDGEKNNIMGSEMKIMSIEKKYSGGEMDIKTKCIGLFKVENFYNSLNNQLYSGAEIIKIKIDNTSNLDKFSSLITLILKYCKLIKLEITSDDLANLNSFELGNLLNLNLNQKYKLTTIESENERIQYLIAHLEHLIPMIKSIEMLQQKSSKEGFNPELN